MNYEKLRLHDRVGLVGTLLILSTLACSTQGLGVVQPTPTLFVLPTLPSSSTPLSPTATLSAEEPAGQDASPAVSSNPLEPVDVCALYTKEEVEALYGQPLEGGDASGTVSMGDTTSYFCTYNAETDSLQIQLTVTPTASVDAAVKKYQETKMILGVGQDVSGLGDEALFDPATMMGGSSLAARQGTFVVSIDLRFTDAPEQLVDEAARLQFTQSIMQTILSRLPQTVAPAIGGSDDAQASSGELNPCALYTQAEVEALFGEQAAIRSNQPQPAPDDSGAMTYTCVYSTVTGYWVTVGVFVYDSADAAIAGYQKYSSMYELTPISELGDEAGYAPDVNMFVMGSGVFVRQGKMLVNTWVTDGGNDLGTPAPATDPAIRSQRSQDIMKTVLSRLPK